MNVLSIHPDLLHSELEGMERIIAKWRVSIGDGIVGVDLPAANAEEKLELFVRQFVGEMLFVAGKAQNMAAILAEQ